MGDWDVTMLAQQTAKTSSVTLWVVGAVCAVVVVAGVLVWRKWFETYHLETVQPGVLYRDGNRGMREFETAVRRIKAKTVVCLVDDNEVADGRKPQFQQQLDWLARQGVKVERIKVKLGGWPTTADVRRFLDVVQAPENQPVLVHCAQGVRRTGMFVAAYQESVLGWDDAKTRDELLTFGHSQRTVKDVQRFIDVYDAKERRVTTELEQSVE